MDDIYAENVIQEANLVADQAARRLSRSETLLHQRGYHAYSAALANMRSKIDKALREVVDELEDK